MRALFPALMSTLLLPAAAQAGRYAVTEVPNVGSLVDATVEGVGPNGTVVGWGNASFGGTLGFKWDPSTGTGNNMWPSGAHTDSRGYDINGAGDSVGVSAGAAEAGVHWNTSLFPDLFDARALDALTINESGYAFGTADYYGGSRWYYYNLATNSIKIGWHLGDGTSTGLDGNNDLDACGYAEVFGVRTAFMERRSLGMVNLGVPAGYIESRAEALTDDERVVVNALGNDIRWDSWVWEGGAMTPLGTIPGYDYTFGEDINNLGQVVGYARNNFANRRAVLWENGLLIDLNDLIPPGSGWALETAVAINDRGDIVGMGNIGGVDRPYLLRGLTTSLTGSCPGVMTATVYGGSPGGTVALEYSNNAGSFTIPAGYPCTGTRIYVGLPLLAGSPLTDTADSAGTTVFSGSVPAGLCTSLRVQAIDVNTCNTSNGVFLP